MKQVREKVLPEADDAWASDASEFDTMAELRANLLDQMVGVPAEERPPWSYYRSRIGKKPPCELSAVDNEHGLAGQATAS